MSIFSEAGPLMQRAEAALKIAEEITRDKAPVHLRQAVLGMLVMGVAELSRELSPEGVAEKVMRDIGKRPG